MNLDLELMHIMEAILLTADTPISTQDFATGLELSESEIKSILIVLATTLTDNKSGIELRETETGWRFYTRADYMSYVKRFLQSNNKTKLSPAALETLAIIAYKQPVSRPVISNIRGVNSAAIVKNLLEKGLIKTIETESEFGAVNYATTEMFLIKLGISSLDELPDISDFLPDIDDIDKKNITELEINE